MASASNEGDNPVGINMTPLVDVIFCLCVFFMTSFKLKQIEGRFDAWLPQTTGSRPDPDKIIVPLMEIRVALFWDETARQSVRKLGTRRIAGGEEGDEELGRLLLEAHDDALRLDKPVPPVTIDAEARVPWGDIVNVVNVCKKSRLDRIEFALPAPPVEPR